MASASKGGGLWDDPSDPTLVFIPYVTPTPWIHAGSNDSLLTARLQQNDGCHLPIRLWKVHGFCLALLPFTFICWHWWNLLSCCELPCGGAHMAKNWEWPLASGPWEVNAVNYRVRELRSGSFFSWTFRWDHSAGWCHPDGSLTRELEVEVPTEPCQKLWNHTCLLFIHC